MPSYVKSSKPAMNLELLIGTAGIIGLISFSTLVKRVYTTKNTSSLPYTWVIMGITAQCLSFTYGFLKGAYGIFIPNFFFILGLSYILYAKINYKIIDTPIVKSPISN